MKLRAILASAEVDPFAKVGGLADVAGSLPKALTESQVDMLLAAPDVETPEGLRDELARMKEGARHAQ